MSLEEKQFYLDLYRKERELLFNAKLEQSKSFDKYIFTISSVGLGLSLTWLGNISKTSEYIPLLILGWIFLAFASMISLSSFLLSQKVIDKHLETINSYIDSLLYGQEYKEQDISYLKIVNFANYTSFLILILGLVCILSFFSINLLKGG